MAGWHHRLDGHEYEQTPGDGDGQGGLACCGPRGRKESDATAVHNDDSLFRCSFCSFFHFYSRNPMERVRLHDVVPRILGSVLWLCSAFYSFFVYHFL